MTCITGRTVPYPSAFIVEAVSGLPSGITVTPGIYSHLRSNDPYWVCVAKTRIDYTTCPNVNLGDYIEIEGIIRCYPGLPVVEDYYNRVHNYTTGWGFLAMAALANVFRHDTAITTWDSTRPNYLSGTFPVSFYCYNRGTVYGEPVPSSHIGTATFRIREIVQ